MFARKKGQKYGNRKVTIDGIVFDSKKEGERFRFLKKAEKEGTISRLERQVVYELIPAVKQSVLRQLKTKNKIEYVTLQRPITYRCDFQYIKDGELIVEDVKSSPTLLTKEFVLKEKLMFWAHNIKIRKVYKAEDPI